MTAPHISHSFYLKNGKSAINSKVNKSTQTRPVRVIGTAYNDDIIITSPSIELSPNDQDVPQSVEETRQGGSSYEDTPTPGQTPVLL